jgi:hypothetical protein
MDLFFFTANGHGQFMVGQFPWIDNQSGISLIARNILDMDPFGTLQGC